MAKIVQSPVLVGDAAITDLQSRVEALELVRSRETTSNMANAAGFPTIQAAVTSLGPAGGTVYLPPGTYPVAYTITLPDKVSLIGAGPQASIITCADTAIPIVTITGSFCSVRHLQIKGPGAAASGTEAGAGIYVNPASSIAGTVIENVHVYDTASWNMLVAATTIKTSVRDCLFYNARSGGSLWIKYGGSTSFWCSETQFGSPGYGTIGNQPLDRGGVFVEAIQGAAFVRCVFENGGSLSNVNSPYITLGDAPHDQALRFVFNPSFRDCYFERPSANTTCTKFLFTTSGIVVNLLIDNAIIINSYASSTDASSMLIETDKDPNTAGSLAVLMDAMISNTHATTYQTAANYTDTTRISYDIYSRNDAWDNITIINCGTNNKDGTAWGSLRTFPVDTNWNKLCRMSDGTGAALMNARGATTYFGAPTFKLPGWANNQITGFTIYGLGSMVFSSEDARFKMYDTIGAAWKKFTIA